jgi:hypothetical protein
LTKLPIAVIVITDNKEANQMSINHPTALLTSTDKLKQALMYVIQDANGDKLAQLAETIMGGECYYGQDNAFALEVVLMSLPADAAGTLRPS